MKNENWRSNLIKSIREDDVNLLEKTLEQVGIANDEMKKEQVLNSVFKFDNMDLTPVGIACKLSSKSCLSVLLKEGADLNKFCVGEEIEDQEKLSWRRNPLHLAIYEGDKECVKMLLEHGADVNINSIEKYDSAELSQNALDIAIEKQKRDLIDLLCKYNVNTMTDSKDKIDINENQENEAKKIVVEEKESWMFENRWQLAISVAVCVVVGLIVAKRMKLFEYFDIYSLLNWSILSKTTNKQLDKIWKDLCSKFSFLHENNFNELLILYSMNLSIYLKYKSRRIIHIQDLLRTKVSNWKLIYCYICNQQKINYFTSTIKSSKSKAFDSQKEGTISKLISKIENTFTTAQLNLSEKLRVVLNHLKDEYPLFTACDEVSFSWNFPKNCFFERLIIPNNYLLSKWTIKNNQFFVVLVTNEKYYFVNLEGHQRFENQHEFQFYTNWLVETSDLQEFLIKIKPSFLNQQTIIFEAQRQHFLPSKIHASILKLYSKEIKIFAFKNVVCLVEKELGVSLKEESETIAKFKSFLLSFSDLGDLPHFAISDISIETKKEKKRKLNLEALIAKTCGRIMNFLMLPKVKQYWTPKDDYDDYYESKRTLQSAHGNYYEKINFRDLYYFSYSENPNYKYWPLFCLDEGMNLIPLIGSFLVSHFKYNYSLQPSLIDENKIEELTKKIHYLKLKFEEIGDSSYLQRSIIYKLAEKADRVHHMFNIQTFKDENDKISIEKVEKKNIEKLENAKCFEIQNLLAKDECEYYIKQATSLGFTSVDWEYAPTYRKCKRVVIKSEKLADQIWDKILPQLTTNELLGIKPFGFGNEGSWIPQGINPCIRFVRYEEGDSFKPHKDGGFVYDDEFRSIFTVIVYLNDNFEGGKTKFYDSNETCVEIIPKIGNSVVFNHDVKHEGTTVKSGVKYILRTDIMFQRIDKHLLENLSLKMSEEHEKAEKLYQKSIQEQKNGNAELSTKFYLEALEIQAKLQSFTKINPFTFLNVKIPMNILRYIISLVGNVKDVCNLMLVSKSFKSIARDGVLWGILYKAKFPNNFKEEQSIFTPKFHPIERFKTNEDFSKDWFNAYKYRIVLEKKFQVVFVDLSEKLKFGNILFEGFDVQEPIIASVQGHYWSATQGMKQFLVGKNALGYERIRDCTYHFWNDNAMSKSLKFDEEIADVMIRHVYVAGFAYHSKWQNHKNYGVKNIREFPLLLIVSPNLNEYERKLISKSISSTMPIPYILVEDSSKMALIARQKKIAVVVSCSQRIACVSVFENEIKIANEFFVIEIQKNPIFRDDNTLNESININFFGESWNLAEKTIQLISSIKNEELRKELAGNIHLNGDIMFNFREKFIQQLSSKSKNSQLSFNVVTEEKEMIINGPSIAASVISGLSNIREKFGDFIVDSSLLK